MVVYVKSQSGFYQNDCDDATGLPGRAFLVGKVGHGGILLISLISGDLGTFLKDTWSSKTSLRLKWVTLHAVTMVTSACCCYGDGVI